MSHVYLTSIKQISAQQPLGDDWFERPVFYAEPYVRAIEPDYKLYFTPNESRRLGRILKRALLVSRQAMLESGVNAPDAIITGTGLGCIESTEIFLDKLVRDGEEMLNPTHFMQSTHNTISSLVAIDAKCHAYNSTYAHKGISFECALLDAFMRLQRGGTALVGAHDEMTPAYFAILKKAGYLGKPNQTFAGETAVAMVLSTQKSEKSLCEIVAMEKIYGHGVAMDADIDYIMVGTNGDDENDRIYYENCAKWYPNTPLLHYKHIFGEGYTVPALGLYTAALSLQKGEVPDYLFVTPNAKNQAPKSFNKILCYNQFEGKNHTFILLSK